MNTNNLKNPKFDTFIDLSSSDCLVDFRGNFSKKYYQNIIAYDLILKQTYTTIMQLPRVDKIVLNTSSKNYVSDKKNIISTLAALELLSGQKPQLTYARKSIANFKLRQHQILGCKVVLRGNRMSMFLDKLVQIIFPRAARTLWWISKSKNFGINEVFENISNSVYFSVFTPSKRPSKRVDAHSFGFQNLMIFPELENHYELVDHFRGLNCTFILLNSTPTTSLLLLSGFQFPVINK